MDWDRLAGIEPANAVLMGRARGGGSAGSMVWSRVGSDSLRGGGGEATLHSLVVFGLQGIVWFSWSSEGL